MTAGRSRAASRRLGDADPPDAIATSSCTRFRRMARALRRRSRSRSCRTSICAALGPDDERSIHLQIEAMKIAIRAAFDHFADARRCASRQRNYSVLPSVASLAASIDAKAAPPAARCVCPSSHDTVYLTAADADGMMVSMIQSNYRGFGSGIVIPGTGIAMQNRGSGFVLDPIAPELRRSATSARITRSFRDSSRERASRAYELRRDGRTHAAPGARADGQSDLRSSAESAGGVGRAALARLRGFQRWPRDRLLRPRSPKRSRRAATQCVTRPAEAMFGGAQLIYRLNDGYCGASDHRKEGLAAGF